MPNYGLDSLPIITSCSFKWSPGDFKCLILKITPNLPDYGNQFFPSYDQYKERFKQMAQSPSVTNGTC